jgi:hypothetical protein
MRLPEMLKKYYDWAKPLTFGFFSDADINEARSYGWMHVQTDFFSEDNALDDYNKMVATPFGLIDHAGVIKCRGNFLMMMSTEFREKQQEARRVARAEANADSLSSSAYAHPSDPRYAEMKAAAEEATGGEGYKLQAQEPEAKKEKRGWPSKKKG